MRRLLPLLLGMVLLALWLLRPAHRDDAFTVLLKEVDTDADARLSLQEFTRCGGREAEFRRNDANADGYLDAAEFRAGYEREDPQTLKPR